MVQRVKDLEAEVRRLKQELAKAHAIAVPAPTQGQQAKYLETVPLLASRPMSTPHVAKDPEGALVPGHGARCTCLYCRSVRQAGCLTTRPATTGIQQG